MEVHKVDVQDPSTWQEEMVEFFSSALPSNQMILVVTLHVYGPLRSDEDWTHVDKHPLDEDWSEHSVDYETRVLKPMIQEWISAIKSTFEAPGFDTHKEGTFSKIVFDFNLTRPTGIDQTARGLLGQAESRTLMRLSNLLSSIFRSHAASLEGIISGSPCWCRLCEQEKHLAALPKGQSYPSMRESHMQEKLNYLRAHWLDESMEHFGGYFLEERKKIGDPTLEHLRGHVGRDGWRCLSLAKEHWDDAHWKQVGEGDDGAIT